MQRDRVHNSLGWAAFDQKHRAQDRTGDKGEADPFPPLLDTTSNAPSSYLIANRSTPPKPFSSVVFSPNNSIDAMHANYLGGSMANNDSAVKLLKDVHAWADDNLIKDILAAVDGNVDQACILLSTMVSNGSLSDEDGPKAEDTLIENKLSGGSNKLPVLKGVLFAPSEPEWEEDDVYLSHRKDALKMMRAASHHSRAASNAFLRGDHFAARQLSAKAREERIASEKLNSTAADEILQLRNVNNDIWKLDQHGLHVLEVVNSLKEHLHKIEREPLIGRSRSSDGLASLEARIVRSPSLEFIENLNMEISAKKVALPQPRQTVLHVITGTGNHSRGQASLPIAVKSFLIESGYRFDDARPGVIAVRPKFRHERSSKP